MSGIIVIGPPRSGTSATTRLLDLSGPSVCRAPDRLGAGPNNPTGHWESKTVLAINNRLLEAAGTRWWCPPREPLAGELGPVDRHAFRDVHPASPWLCKDPRFAFTLPAWRSVLGDRSGVVVVLRRPGEVTASIRRTWNLTVDHAAALWARYLTGAVAAATALPTVTVRFPELLSAVPAAVSAIGAALPDELVLGTPPADEVEHFVVAPRGDGREPGGDRVPVWADELWEAAISATPAVVGRPGTLEEPAEVELILGGLRDELRAGRPIDTRPVFGRESVG